MEDTSKSNSASIQLVMCQLDVLHVSHVLVCKANMECALHINRVGVTLAY